MQFLLHWRFLPHLWTLSGLAFAMAGLAALFNGDEEWAARLIFFPILIDFTDGTLARRFRLDRHIPAVSGASLDMITDVIALNFAPLLFFWQVGVFVPQWQAAICIAAMLTCGLKYGMKENVLRQGYSVGSTPIFFSVFLFYILELNPIWASLYTIALIALCLLPIRYPITSHVTTHWRFGWKSMTNYATVLCFVPVMVWMKDLWDGVAWAVLGIVLVQLYLYPVLLRFEFIVRPGFDRYS